MLIIFLFSFDNRVGWQALDYVIAEARQHGIRLLLSLVNDWKDYGGKAQYVKWALEEGTAGLSASNDSFFFNPSIRSNFKNYIKVLYIFSTSTIWYFHLRKISHSNLSSLL
jgi:mannan endo-1,4-beta-mannosidase